ncbi:MAG: glycosyltransferase family 2 protein [Patescibacteria group bacterium]
MEQNKLVSIIIPCVNEEKNINRTIDKLLDIAKNHRHSFEIIAINDGSTDNTWGVIKEYAEKYPEIKGINFMTNYGQSAAYTAGFETAKGDYVVVASADLEIPLENINRVIEFLDQGYDFVNTNRKGRWGKGSRSFVSKVANLIIERTSKVKVKDTGSGVKGITKNIAKNLKLYGGMHRLIPQYASVYGPRFIEFDVDFKERDYGESAYKGQKRTLGVLLDILTLSFMIYFAKKPFRAMPGRLFGFTGAVVSGLGGIIAFYLLILKIMGESIGNRPLLTLSVLLIIVGIQSMMMGLIGELMMRVYFESSGRKPYMIRETIN